MSPHPAPPPDRDRSLDVLRGWAIVLMLVSHVGARSWLTTLLHLPLWISAATPFVVLAGVVLGLRQIEHPAPHRVWRRAASLWGVHVILMILVVAVHEATGRLHAPSVASMGGPVHAAWKISVLRVQSIDYMNILPLFVVFLALAPLVVAAIRKGRAWLALAPSCVLWGAAQIAPERLRFTDPISGADVFVLAAWQLPFVLGVCAGARWTALSQTIWPLHRRWVLPLLITVMSALFTLAQLQRNVAARLGQRLPPWTDWLVAKATWGPLRGLYLLGLMILGYLLLERLRQRGRPFEWLGPVEWMGQRSLYCFLVHLPIALLASALGLMSAPRWSHEVAAVAVVVTVYVMSRFNILGRFVPG